MAAFVREGKVAARAAVALSAGVFSTGSTLLRSTLHGDSCIRREPGLMASGVPSDPQILWLSVWLCHYLVGASHAPAACGCRASAWVSRLDCLLLL